MTDALRLRRPGVRIAGSAASWLFVSLGLGLLFTVTSRVMAVGGSCASGGPYEIAVPCPDGVEVFILLSLLCAGIGVVAMVVLAPDFGVSLVGFGWLMLFGGLGWFFLQAFFQHGDPTGVIVGVVFGLMGVAPLIFLLINAPRAVFLGRSDARGRLYAAEGFWRPRPLDYVLSIGVWLIASAAGYGLALVIVSLW